MKFNIFCVFVVCAYGPYVSVDSPFIFLQVCIWPIPGSQRLKIFHTGYSTKIIHLKRKCENIQRLKLISLLIHLNSKTNMGDPVYIIHDNTMASYELDSAWPFVSHIFHSLCLTNRENNLVVFWPSLHSQPDECDSKVTESDGEK